VSPVASLALGWSSSAMRARAARGSPWLPVASARICRGGYGRTRRATGTAGDRRDSRTRGDLRRYDALHRPAERDDLTGRWRGPPRPPRAQPRDIGGEGGDEHAPLASPMISVRLLATSVSTGSRPSRKMLVRTSQISASTPSSPSSRNRLASVVEPTSGVGSIFQSRRMGR